MIGEFSAGDTVEMKKPHACGGNEWLITRTGADIKLKCLRCERLIMMDRLDFLKRAKRVTARGGESNDSGNV